MIRGNAVSVDKVYRPRCHLLGCAWMGDGHQAYADANAEREEHLREHREAEAEAEAHP
jgi:hypothetical protein